MLNLSVVIRVGSFSRHAVYMNSLCEYYDLYDRDQFSGLIDGNIFFNLGSIPSKTYYPKSGDVVRVSAVECEKSAESRQCSWRATRVVPCPSVNLFRWVLGLFL